MAQLGARQRRRIPSSKFVYPKVRKYPIDTKGRARSALRLAARRNTYGSAATVRRAVYRRYPGLRPRRKRAKSRR